MFHMPNSCGVLATATRPKSSSSITLYTIRKYFLNKRTTFRLDLLPYYTPRSKSKRHTVDHSQKFRAPSMLLLMTVENYKYRIGATYVSNFVKTGGLVLKFKRGVYKQCIYPIDPDGPWGPPSLLYNVYRVFIWGKAAEAWLEHPPHLALRLKKE
jgi:hypothetical protein